MTTRKLLTLHLDEETARAFDHVMIAKPDAPTLRQALDMRHISNKALASVRAGEVVVVSSGKRPVRSHAVDPDMIEMQACPTSDILSETPEPWDAPAVNYPTGPALPRLLASSRLSSKATVKPIRVAPTTRPVPSRITQSNSDKSAKPTPSLVTKDDLVSSHARLKRALARRTATQPKMKTRTI